MAYSRWVAVTHYLLQLFGSFFLVNFDVGSGLPSTLPPTRSCSALTQRLPRPALPSLLLFFIKCPAKIIDYLGCKKLSTSCERWKTFVVWRDNNVNMVITFPALVRQQYMSSVATIGTRSVTGVCVVGSLSRASEVVGVSQSM